MQRIFNISTIRVGGIRFLKVGRFCFSFCVTAEYRPTGQPKIPARQLDLFRRRADDKCGGTPCADATYCSCRTWSEERGAMTAPRRVVPK